MSISTLELVPRAKVPVHFEWLLYLLTKDTHFLGTDLQRLYYQLNPVRLRQQIVYANKSLLSLVDQESLVNHR